jgi:hypothetical protein
MKAYKNLFIWIVIILFITLVIDYYYQFPLLSMMSMQILMWVWFLIFGSMKLIDITWFSNMFSDYDPLAQYIRGYGQIYPFLEILLWWLYLRDISMHYSLMINSIVIIMTAITSIGITIQLYKRSTLYCVCMGSKITTPLWLPSLIEQIWMCIMAIWMITMMI